ncbi:39S ribosomal protein L51, mitochondrial [Gaertneriomyces sp. JEL0708]|nr:39S ribosomal protein L51, mitochondrial [Gaertneriomyces sp. JEL0708]
MSNSRAAWKTIRKLQDAGLLKRVMPEKDITSKPLNGVSTFVPSINKLTIHYDPPSISSGGPSLGMVSFLKLHLANLARQRPYVEICVQPRRAQPPALIATYANGHVKQIETPRMSPGDIAKQFNFLCDTNAGEQVKVKRGQPVKKVMGKMSDRVEGVWDPFTAKQTFKP